MARVIVSPAAAGQIDQCRSFYEEPAIGVRAVKTMLVAFRRQTGHSAIGRPVPEDEGLRELVIPFGNYGFVALYAYARQSDTVIILAVRHQRQAGYDRNGDSGP